jgi:hypothetical protein
LSEPIHILSLGAGVQRKENAEINVKALERILAKPLSNEERVYFENQLAAADAKLQKALNPRVRLTKRQKASVLKSGNALP